MKHPSSINAEKPREFWVVHHKDDQMFVETSKEEAEDHPRKPEIIHVIEYSAYEQVVKDWKELCAVVAKYMERYGTKLG